MPESNSDSKAPTRNALTKISGIFGRTQKPRWIQDFHILLSHSDPNKRYKPGDVVRGEVHIKPTKPTRVTHITVALYGYAQVFKNFNAPGDGLSKEASHIDPSRLLTSPGIVKLFNPVERTLHGECKLPNRLLRFQFAIPLPAHRLPTSIDFERGSIAYQLIATITRPTAIAPVLRCDPRKLYVNEDLDIAIVPTPKPRYVTLMPVEPRSKNKRGKKTGSRTNSDSNSNPSDRPESSASSRSHSRSDSRASFSQSDNASVSNGSVSIDFRIQGNNSNASGSSNGGMGVVGGEGGSGSSSRHNSNPNNSTGGGGSNAGQNPGMASNSGSGKHIFGSAELLRGGFLPGDKIPVKVVVRHYKPIKSMCGVIITLYRKTHIDTQPVLHKADVDENGRPCVKMVMPDVYEKSLTGFGGLSLSNSGTSSTYRMDIAQTTLPLIVNPATMRAEITTNVEIPHEGITPTITKVRGQSIDFRYFVEVCLDLQGKLENARLLPRLTDQPLYGFGKPSASTNTAVPLNLAQQGLHLIDTQHIRRERPQIVTWQFHVIVGTRDSNRAARKRLRDGWQRGDGPIALPPLDASESGRHSDVSGGDSGNSHHHHHHRNHAHDPQGEWAHDEAINLRYSGPDAPDAHELGRIHEIRHGAVNGSTWNDSAPDLHQLPRRATSPPPLPPSLPMPEEPLNEKERLRLYEERLLPSAPPPLDSGAPSYNAPGLPSAPPAEFVDDGNETQWDPEEDLDPHDSGYNSSGSGPYYRGSRPRLHSRPSHASHLTMVEEDEDGLYNGDQPLHLDEGEEGEEDGDSFQPHHANDAWPLTNGDHPPNMHRSVSSREPSSPHAYTLRHESAGMARSTSDPTDDKQELERRRLMAQQSAPRYEDDMAAASSSRQQPEPPAPAVPALGDLVEGEEHHHAAFGEWVGRHEELPKYER